MKKVNFSLAILWLAMAIQANAESSNCQVEILEIPLDQVSELGFSGQKLIDNITNSAPSDLWNWGYKDGQTTLTVTVQPLSATARYVKQRAIDPSNTYEICVSYLEVDAQVSFRTDDGGFNESWTTTIYDTEHWGSPILWPDMQPGTETKIDYHLKADQVVGSFYKDVEPINHNILFNVWIAFNEVHGLRATVSGFSNEKCDEEGCVLASHEGGKTNNFFAPLGLKPGEKPVLEIELPLEH